MTILTVEDDEMISEGLRYSLMQENFEVISVGKVSEAFEIIHSGKDIDICLLDITLPDGSGYNVCREIRKDSNIPILFITACDDEMHTVMALEQGADDYITKPFRIRELIARIKAILRRTSNEDKLDGSIVKIGENTLNITAAKMYRNNEEILLTAMEYKLLLIFVSNRGQTLSREQILDRIWDEVGAYVNDNTLTVYIKRLRKKLGDSNESQIIKTVRGVGYRMD